MRYKINSAAAKTPSMELTEEQQAVIEAARELRRGQTLKIEACAGSGKTFTLRQIALSQPDKRFLYLAFNRAIVESARRKFPPNVKIYTTHSLANQWFRWKYGDERLNKIAAGYRVFDIEHLFPKVGYKALAGFLKGYREFLQSARREPLSDPAALIFKEARAGRLPMTHDLYLKLWQLEGVPRFRNYDCVLLDEAQDTNPVTMALFADNNCARILVGDTHQSIYAFRGAVNALENVPAERTLHLTCSFRSTQPILDQANYFLSTYAADRAGFKPMRSLAPVKKGVQEEAVLTRTNAGIIQYIAGFSEAQMKKCRLLRTPEEIFSAALSVLAFKEGRYDDLDPLYKWLKRFNDFDDLESYAETCYDPEISGSLRLVQIFNKDLIGLYEKAAELRGKTEGTLTLGTAHSAKGLEWDKVTLSNDFEDLGQMHEQVSQRSRRKNSRPNPQDFEQALNLYYVALTRARHTLKDGSDNCAEYKLAQRLAQHPEDPDDAEADLMDLLQN